MSSRHTTALVVTAIIAGGVGFVIGHGPVRSSSQNAQSLAFQTGTLEGQVTKVSPDSVEIKDTQGQTTSLPLADNVAIYKTSSPSSDIKTLDMNTNVHFTVQSFNGIYKIVSVIYPLRK